MKKCKIIKMIRFELAAQKRMLILFSTNLMDYCPVSNIF